jgi:hypothetical protein
MTRYWRAKAFVMRMLKSQHFLRHTVTGNCHARMGMGRRVVVLHVEKLQRIWIVMVCVSCGAKVGVLFSSHVKGHYHAGMALQK